MMLRIPRAGNGIKITDSPPNLPIILYGLQLLQMMGKYEKVFGAANALNESRCFFG